MSRRDQDTTFETKTKAVTLKTETKTVKILSRDKTVSRDFPLLCAGLFGVETSCHGGIEHQRAQAHGMKKTCLLCMINQHIIADFLFFFLFLIINFFKSP